jgi:hypothetical protein
MRDSSRIPTSSTATTRTRCCARSGWWWTRGETDRYISWPAQALGYKVGQLAILGLREKAKKELGPRFDIRKFHDEVLGAGALPMDVLDARIDAWIASQKAGAATS